MYPRICLDNYYETIRGILREVDKIYNLPTMQNQKLTLIIKKEFCKECGFCIHVCPDNALRFSTTFNSKGYHPVKWKGECKFCGQCYIICPDYVIEVSDNEETMAG